MNREEKKDESTIKSLEDDYNIRPITGLRNIGTASEVTLISDMRRLHNEQNDIKDNI